MEKLLVEKPDRFWKNEIFELREKWRNVVKRKDTYIHRQMYIEWKYKSERTSRATRC